MRERPRRSLHDKTTTEHDGRVATPQLFRGDDSKLCLIDRTICPVLPYEPASASAQAISVPVAPPPTITKPTQLLVGRADDTAEETGNRTLWDRRGSRRFGRVHSAEAVHVIHLLGLVALALSGSHRPSCGVTGITSAFSAVAS